MEKFKCTKTVLAMPMSRGKYNEYQGWAIPADEDPTDAGYLVEYIDSPNGNHPDHANYISWSPADVFEAGYNPIGSFKDRLVLEKEELEAKVIALDKFLDGNKPANMSKEMWELLARQHQVMNMYLTLLVQRLEML